MENLLTKIFPSVRDKIRDAMDADEAKNINLAISLYTKSVHSVEKALLLPQHPTENTENYTALKKKLRSFHEKSNQMFISHIQYWIG
jgi:hypothetical protein